MLGIVAKDLQYLPSRSGPGRGLWRDGSEVKEPWLFFLMTSTHMMAYNCLLTPVPGDPVPLSGLLGYLACTWCRLCVDKTPMRIKIKVNESLKKNRSFACAEGRSAKGGDGRLPWRTGRASNPEGAGNQDNSVLVTSKLRQKQLVGTRKDRGGSKSIHRACRPGELMLKGLSSHYEGL